MGLLIMFLSDFVFAIWLGSSVGFGGVARGSMNDFKRKSQ